MQLCTAGEYTDHEAYANDLCIQDRQTTTRVRQAIHIFHIIWMSGYLLLLFLRNIIISHASVTKPCQKISCENKQELHSEQFVVKLISVKGCKCMHTVLLTLSTKLLRLHGTVDYYSEGK